MWDISAHQSKVIAVTMFWIIMAAMVLVPRWMMHDWRPSGADVLLLALVVWQVWLGRKGRKK